MKILAIDSKDVERIHDFLKILGDLKHIDLETADKALGRTRGRNKIIIMKKKDSISVTLPSGSPELFGYVAGAKGVLDGEYLSPMKGKAYVIGRKWTKEKPQHHYRYFKIDKGNKVTERSGKPTHASLSRVQLVVIPEGKNLIMYNTGLHYLALKDIDSKETIYF